MQKRALSQPVVPADASAEPLSARLRRAREAMGLDREELALRLEVGRAIILRWETGTLAPTAALAPSIMNVLGVEVQEAETNAQSIPALRTVTLGGVDALAELDQSRHRSFEYGAERRDVQLAPYVVNGPPDQREFHDELVRLQEQHGVARSSWSTYRRRLSLVTAADGEPTAQSLLEKPRSSAVSWSSNYGSHGWHRYVGRFPPHLVRGLLNSFGAGPDTLVCDPFAGSGTTLVECRLLGIPAIGIEISPLSALISRTKARFPDHSVCLRETVAKLDRFFAEAELNGIRARSLSHADVLSRDGNSIPSFPNVGRWFTPEALLGVSLTTEFAASLDGFERDAMLVALSAKMRSIGNVDVDVVRAEYRKEPREKVDVRALVSRHLLKMGKDIEASLVSHAGLMGPPESVSVHEGNLLTAPVEPGSVSHIITSPPYGVESLSYFRTHLLSFRSLERFLNQDPYVVGDGVIGSEYLDEAPEVTSFPRAEHSTVYRRFFAGTALEELPRNDRRRAVMMMKFFDDMAIVGERFSQWLAPGGYVAFVVGNKKLGDRVVPTAEVVTELFEEQGLRLRRELRHKLKTNNSNSVVPWQERIINEEYVLVFRHEG